MKTLLRQVTNALVIHGGGLVEPSKEVLLRIAWNLSAIYDQVYIGYYSFESLYTPKYIVRYTEGLLANLSSAWGVEFGTCRDIDFGPMQENLFVEAIKCLKRFNINTIVVAGGDGSARLVSETVKMFESFGINIIFLAPLTIDGINGSEVIGINEAVRISVKLTEDVVATHLRTKNGGKFGVSVTELQGRNRDDILAKVLFHFHNNWSVGGLNFNEIKLLAVPGNIEYNKDSLMKEVSNTDLPTLILASEGAFLKPDEIESATGRKTRLFQVGHVSQSNRMMTDEDLNEYKEWIDTASAFVKDYPLESFCVVRRCGIFYDKMPINFLGDLNPRNLAMGKAEMDDTLIGLVKDYMP